MQIGTFSLVAYDVSAGECGVAVSTGMPAIGGLSVYAHAAAGALATQALVNPLIGVDGLRLLRSRPADEALREVLRADPHSELRQAATVDACGRAAAHTGTDVHPWSGHRLGDGYAVAGNTLAGSRVLEAMARRFEESSGRPMAERLLRSLEAAKEAGGDRRGEQSAALYVHRGRPYPYLDLRVDWHPEPVAELRRVYEAAEPRLRPFVDALPTRENPGGDLRSLLEAAEVDDGDP